MHYCFGEASFCDAIDHQYRADGLHFVFFKRSSFVTNAGSNMPWSQRSTRTVLRDLGQTNLISRSTDPTDPVFAESKKKNKKRPKKFLYACKKS